LAQTGARTIWATDVGDQELLGEDLDEISEEDPDVTQAEETLRRGPLWGLYNNLKISKLVRE
jgi:hypothetical protein